MIFLGIGTGVVVLLTVISGVVFFFELRKESQRHHSAGQIPAKEIQRTVSIQKIAIRHQFYGGEVRHPVRVVGDGEIVFSGSFKGVPFVTNDYSRGRSEECAA